MVTNGGVGAATGFTINAGADFVRYENVVHALRAGAQGAAIGGISSGASGFVQALKNAYSLGINPWTGESCNYPPNHGFLKYSTPRELQPGEIVDRYGGTGKKSSFLSPEGVSIGERSLMPGTNFGIYERYEVVKPFTVNSGLVMPWYGQPGMGIQYQTQNTIFELINQGYLRPIK